MQEDNDLDHDANRPVTPVNKSDPPSAAATPQKQRNANGKRQLEDAPVKYAALCRGAIREEAEKCLRDWRHGTRQEKYRDTSWTSAALLPDVLLKKIASDGTIWDLEHFTKLSPAWIFVEEHGAELIELLTEIDECIRLQKERDTLEKRNKQKQETIEKKKAEQTRKEVAAAQASKFWDMISWQMLAHPLLMYTPIAPPS